MTSRNSFEKNLDAIAASKTPRECADAIMLFARSIEPGDLTECHELLHESPLGGAILASGLLPGMARYLSPGADTHAREWVRQRPARDFLEWVFRDLVHHYETRYNPELERWRTSLAREYLSLWERINSDIGGFFLLHYPSMAEAMNIEAGGPGAMLRDLEATIETAATGGDAPRSAGTDPRAFRRIYDAFSRRRALECRYLSGAYRALAASGSENRLIAMARRAASVPPSLQRDFWGEEFLEPELRADYPGIMALLENIRAAINTGGLAAAESLVDGIDDDILRESLRLSIDGTDPELIRRMCAIKQESIRANLAIFNDIIIRGVLGIQAGNNPRIMEELKKDYSRIGTYCDTPEALTDAFVSLAEKARREGLLSLEDHLYMPQDITGEGDELPPADELIEEREERGADVVITSEIMKKGLMLIVDGTDPELVREIMRDHAKNEARVLGKLLDMTIQGVLAVQSGDNPRIVEEKLRAYEAGARDTAGAVDTLAALTKKARRAGLPALDGDVNGLGSNLMSLLLRLAINMTPPEIIGDIGREASLKAQEDAETYCGFCAGAALLLAEAPGMKDETSPSFVDDSLAPLVPFYGSARPGTFAGERAVLEPHLLSLRAALIAGPGPGLSPGRNFPLALAADPAHWDAYFLFRETLAHTSAAISFLDSFLSAGTADLPSIDIGREIGDAIKAALGRHGSKSGTTASAAHPLDRTIAGIETALRRIEMKSRDDSAEQVEILSRLRRELTGVAGAITAGKGEESPGPIPINDLPGLIPDREIRELVAALVQIKSSADCDVRAPVEGLLRGCGAAISPGFTGSRASLAAVIAGCPDLYGYETRMRLYSDLAPAFGLNALSPTSDLLLFDDISRLDDLSIQKLLREVDTQDLAIAMHGADAGICKRIYGCMSPRAGELLREDIEYMGNIRLVHTMGSRKKILTILSKLIAGGDITMPETAGAVPAAAYGRVKEMTLSLVALLREANRLAARKKHESLQKLLRDLEKKHDMTIWRTVQDWSAGYYWEVTPPAPENAWEPEERKILDELAPGETDRYISPLTVDYIINHLWFRYRIETFDDLVRLEDVSIMKVAYNAPEEDLVKALKGAGEAITARMLASLPRDLRDIISEDLSLIRPAAGEIEEARSRILKLSTKLSEAGEITLADDQWPA
jgi:flagellar motor component MotA